MDREERTREVLVYFRFAFLRLDAVHVRVRVPDVYAEFMRVSLDLVWFCAVDRDLDVHPGPEVGTRGFR